MENIKLMEEDVQFAKKSYRAPFKVHCMALSPVNDLIAIGSKSGDIMLKRTSWKQIWKMNVSQLGSLGRPLPKPSSLVCLEFSPTGEALAAATNDGHVHIIDVESGNYKHTSKVGDDRCPCSITRLRWFLHYKDDMTLTDTDKFMEECTLEAEDDHKMYRPPKLPGQSTLYESCLDMLTQKPDVAQEDIGFVFQMLEEDSAVVKSEEGMEDQLESTFISNQKFRKSYKGTMLVAIRDDFIVTVLAAGVFPIANLDINKHCEHLNLSLVMLYDAYYSRHTGGLTVAATTYGKRPFCGETGRFGKPVLVEGSNEQVHTHIFNFHLDFEDRVWELAMRHLRLCYGFALLFVSFETCRKNWDNQIQILHNRFDTGTTSMRIGELLIDMFLSGTTDPTGEAFLERGMSQEGLDGIKEFCDKHLIELSRVVRGQLTSAVRNISFQAQEFVNCAKLMMKNAHCAANRDEILLTSYMNDPRSPLIKFNGDNAVILRLERDAARLELKHKQLVLACSIMLQELSHLIKWMQALKPFARGMKANMLIGFKRMDIKLLMKYVTKNFVVDAEWRKKYEDVMFDIERFAKNVQKDDERDEFDEMVFFENAKKDAYRSHEDYRRELRKKQPESAEYVKPEKETETQPKEVVEVDPNADPNAEPSAEPVEVPPVSLSPPKDPRKSDEPAVDLDRVGSFFTKELSFKAMEVMPFAGDFLNGIESECSLTHPKWMDLEVRQMGLEAVLEDLMVSIVSSTKVLEASPILAFKIDWMYEVDSAPTHQGFKDFRIANVILDNAEALNYNAYVDNRSVRRAIQYCGITNKTFETQALMPPLTEIQQEFGHLNRLENTIDMIPPVHDGAIDSYTIKYEIENCNPIVIEVPKATDENAMEVDTNLGQDLKVIIDNEERKNVFNKIVEFESCFAMNNYECFAVAKFERSDGEPGSMKRFMRFNRQTRFWIVQDNAWGSSDVLEWAYMHATALRGAYVHDDGARVAIFNSRDKSIGVMRPPTLPVASTQPQLVREPSTEGTATTYREFQARRERLRKTLPFNFSSVPNSQRVQYYLQEMQDEDHQDVDYEAIMF